MDVLVTREEQIAQLEAELAALEAATAPAVEVEHNDPPTPDHVWDGEKWLLPKEHEDAMLAEMSDD